MDKQLEAELAAATSAFDAADEALKKAVLRRTATKVYLELLASSWKTSDEELNEAAMDEARAIREVRQALQCVGDAAAAVNVVIARIKAIKPNG